MAQKKPKTRNVRNILATPFTIHWSESNPEGVALLQKALEKLLPLAKLVNRSLKHHSRSETKEKMPSETIQKKKQINIFRTYLTPGFQSVIRALEKKELCCVVLSSDINHPMLQRVVCSYCHTHDIPVMIISQLKTITKATLGFPTMVLGLKKIAESTENLFFPIYEIVSQNRSVFETPLVAKQSTDVLPEENYVNDSKPGKSCISSTTIKDIYLYRESRDERVFRTGLGINNQSGSQIQHQSEHRMDGDFISFAKNGTNSSKFEHVRSKNTKSDNKTDTEDDDSDCDSIDDDNMFFVDNEPDQMLLDKDQSNCGDDASQTNPAMQRVNLNLTQNSEGEEKSNKKFKTMSERYFSGNLKQDKKGNKAKTVLTQIAKGSKKSASKQEYLSPKFNPMTIKTVSSNPKKIRRKKK